MVGDDVVISVDPHKASNTAAVIDPVTRTVIARHRLANTAAGYQQLRGFAENSVVEPRRPHRIDMR